MIATNTDHLACGHQSRRLRRRQRPTEMIAKVQDRADALRVNISQHSTQRIAVTMYIRNDSDGRFVRPDPAHRVQPFTSTTTRPLT